jgi:hypothetical protein
VGLGIAIYSVESERLFLWEPCPGIEPSRKKSVLPVAPLRVVDTTGSVWGADEASNTLKEYAKEEGVSTSTGDNAVCRYPCR